MSIEDATPVTEGARPDAAGRIPSPRNPWSVDHPPAARAPEADPPVAAVGAEPEFDAFDGPTGELPVVVPTSPPVAYPPAAAGYDGSAGHPVARPVPASGPPAHPNGGQAEDYPAPGRPEFWLPAQSPHPVSGRPILPDVGQTAYPVSGRPALPDVDRSAYPVSDRPVLPDANQPAYPTSGRPALPDVDQLAHPVSDRPALPDVGQPDHPPIRHWGDPAPGQPAYPPTRQWADPGPGQSAYLAPGQLPPGFAPLAMLSGAGRPAVEPLAAPAGWAPPVAPSPWPEALAVPLRPERRRGRVGRVLTVCVLVLLLAAAGAEAYQMKRLTDRLDRADRSRAAAQVAADSRIGSLTTRVTELENTLAAQLDPISVAAQIAPSVYELDAGDFLGTAWAVRNSSSGTDLITNYHVVAAIYKQGKRAVELVRGTERIKATVVKVSTANDVALVHVARTLPVLDVNKAVVSGEAVLVEGTPLGWQASVTTGVVSNVERRVRTANGVIDYFQFDAAINPGNSGGPVVDARGRVLGVASAVFIDTENDVPAQSMSLAIPITTACRVLAAC